MPLEQRLALAAGLPLRQRLFAAMAQQDCGQCGYLCATYAAALAAGSESKINLCVPGGKATSRALKQLLPATPDPPVPPTAAPALVAGNGDAARVPGYGRDRPVRAIFRSAGRSVAVAGNVGTPVSSVEAADWVVCELSLIHISEPTRH